MALLSFLMNHTQDLNYREVAGLVTKNISFLVCCESRSTSKVCQVQKTFIK